MTTPFLLSERVSEIGCRSSFSCWPDGLRCGYEFCEFSQVLGGGRVMEFVSGAARPSQSKSSQTEDAFEMGEPHLDLFRNLREIAYCEVCEMVRATSRAGS